VAQQALFVEGLFHICSLMVTKECDELRVKLQVTSQLPIFKMMNWRKDLCLFVQCCYEMCTLFCGVTA